MTGPYTITVTPKFIAEGKRKGQIQGLRFRATDGQHEHRWRRVVNGTLAEDFRALFGAWGPYILERLRNGETLNLPRGLELDEARRIGAGQKE